ncbi:MAG: S49 family peptidase [Chloroflexi bacterium]|nr:S49 family peptidase [Chloroflexota bacterium]
MRILGRSIAQGPVAYGAAVVLGIIAAALVFYYVAPGRPYVGIVRLPYFEIDDYSTAQIEDVLRFAERDRRIKALAIEITSPGGSAAASEQLYQDILRIRESGPVVISVGWIAASGGYMMASAGDYIYAGPSSFVGNVGVIIALPGEPSPDEQIVATGPFKLTGGTREQYVSMLEVLKNAFVRIVYTQRGDRLKLTPEELADGRIHLGIDAARLGIVDALGTPDDAVVKAAELAGLRNYGRVDVIQEYSKSRGQTYFSLSRPPHPQTAASASVGATTAPLGEQSRYHRFYYLYVEPTK